MPTEEMKGAAVDWRGEDLPNLYDGSGRREGSCCTTALGDCGSVFHCSTSKALRAGDSSGAAVFTLLCESRSFFSGTALTRGQYFYCIKGWKFPANILFLNVAIGNLGY